MNDMPEIQYFGFKCRVVSPEWAELVERDRLDNEVGDEARVDRAARMPERSELANAA
jgi:hypothetical protein